MSDNKYAVAFSGVVVPGANREQVKQNLAKLFKVEVAKIEPMFSGRRVVIKAQLDQATALKYQAALKSAGAICEVIDTSAVAAKAAQPAAAAAAKPVAKPSAPAAATARGTGTAAPNWQVDQPGVTLVAPREVPPLQVDLSGLTMAEAGVVLVEHQEQRAPSIDTGHLSVAAAGSDLVEAKQVAELQVDLSGLTMAEAGVTLVAPKKVEEPEIDTSKLSLG